MRVICWPADDGACGNYRLILPAQALAEQGGDVKVDFTGPMVLWDREWHGQRPPPSVNLIGLDKRPDADVVVLQRPGQRWWADLIPHLQRAGIRVVVDVDDRFDLIHPDNGAHAVYDPRRIGHHNHEWIARACQRADLVTATTPELARRYGYGHGLVLPNLVPARYLDVRAFRRPRTVGWSGHVATHPGDLEVTRGAVGVALRGSGWSFHVVGSAEGVKERLGLAEEPSATGQLAFGFWPARVAQLEVGIVPLADTAFNRAKSALKASEMASVGVPVVMSPTPDNVRLNKLGIGLLAGSPNHWRRHLSRLIASPEARTDLAGKGREAMATQTYEARADLWADAWLGRKASAAA